MSHKGMTFFLFLIQCILIYYLGYTHGKMVGRSEGVRSAFKSMRRAHERIKRILKEVEG